MDRDAILSITRECFELPIVALIKRLNATLLGLSQVPHMDISDPRAVGSVLNNALRDAAEIDSFSNSGLSTTYTNNGQSNKITGKLLLEGVERPISIELHLSGSRGGTSKQIHQFACKDIEEQSPYMEGFEPIAPQDLLFFLTIHLSGTGASIDSAYIKFADGVDTKKIKIDYQPSAHTDNAITDTPANIPAGSKLVPKKSKNEGKAHGGTDKRSNAAPGSK